MKRTVSSCRFGSVIGLALVALLVAGVGCASPGSGDDGDDQGDDFGDDEGDDEGDDGGDDGPSCGDGTCSGSETVASCPGDCDTCGDGVCQATESAASCPGDCDTCGDGVCQATETPASCPGDCNVCGDTVCQAGEATSCPDDCPASLTVQNNSSYYIDSFYVAPCGGEWSADLLDGYINPGSFATLDQIPAGCWYFWAAAGSSYWQSDAITLQPSTPFTWTLYN